MKGSNNGYSQDRAWMIAEASEMSERILDFDWSATSLGPITSWPQSLKTCVHIMLSSRQPIWIGWGKDLIKLYNDPYKSIVGGKHPWALGTPASTVWKDIWKDIEPLLKQVMEKGVGTYVESQLLIMERNGYPEETYYTFSYTPVPGEDGQIAGMFCANTDDTERIINQRQLQTLTQLGKKLVDCKSAEEIISKTLATFDENPYDFPFAIFRKIDKSKAIFAGATMLGSAHEFVPSCYDLDTDVDPIALAIKEALTTKRSLIIDEVSERRNKMPTGAWSIAPKKIIVLPIVLSGMKEAFGTLTIGLNPYRLMDEKYEGFFSLIVDQVAASFADVNAYEEEKKRAEALAAIDHAKTIFFSNISHELRTPLTLMLSPIEDVMNDVKVDPEHRSRLNIANTNARRLLKLVNSLLDFSRIEAGRMKARYERTNLAEATKDLASGFREMIEKSGINLIVSCDPTTEGYVDKDMWDKIVLNLISNAFKYTLTGRIEIILSHSDSSVDLTVKDTGVGIPETDLHKIFERFHRVENTARSQEGTGIGLSLVQELVNLHKGSISVKSTLGEGSAFTVSLPAGKAHLPADMVLDQEIHTDSTIAHTYIEEALKWLPANKNLVVEANDLHVHTDTGLKPAKKKVFLADDNADMRDYLSRLLRKNYEVTAVDNGQTLLEMVEVMQPDLILSDVMMPRLNGFELVKCLKADADKQHIPVILLSARAGEEATVEGLSTGADDYLVKPFSAAELLSRIDSNIRIAESRAKSVKKVYDLFMKAPFAIAILKGAEQRFELSNDKYLELAGKTAVVGKTLEEAFPELAETGIRELLDKVYTTNEPYYGSEFKVDLVRQGKVEHLFLNFVYTPFKDDDDTTTGVMVVATDVTDMVLARKIREQNEIKLEEEVRQRTKELRDINIALERSNKELEQYAYVTSHDLQEPLRKIQLFNSMLVDQLKKNSNEQVLNYADKITESAKRMTTLIKELLEFSRLSQTGQRFEQVDLDTVLDDVLKDFELSLNPTHFLITRAPLGSIDAIPLQMRQLFYNLISNAIKFRKRDGDLELKVKAAALTPSDFKTFADLDKETDYIKITLEDNGIGFDQEFSDKIFTLFQRLNNRKTYEGHGIGLAICKKVIENHKGFIAAYGSEEKGAIFTLILPVRQE